MGGAGGLIGSRQRLMNRVLASHCLSVAGAGSRLPAACISLSPYRSLCCSGATHGSRRGVGVGLRGRPRQRCGTPACQRDRVDSGFLQRGNPVVGGCWERLEEERAPFGSRPCQGVRSSCAGHTLPERVRRDRKGHRRENPRRRRLCLDSRTAF